MNNEIIFIMTSIYILLFLIVALAHLINAQMGDGYLTAVYVVANTGKHEPIPEFYNSIHGLKNTVNGDNKGHLTHKGKEQMYVMGARLKRHYSNSLEEIKDKNKINVTSMNNPRSFESAKLLLAGLMGQSRQDSLGKDWGYDKHVDEIKIHDFYENSLKAFFDKNDCKSIFTTNVKKHLGEANTTYSALKTKIKQKLNDFSEDGIWKLYSHLVSLKNNNKDLPAGLTYDDMLDMKEYVDTFVRSLFNTIDLKRLSAGVYVKEFVELLDKFRTSRYNAGPKMRIFAAEEMNFAAIIAALGGEKNYQICGEDKPMGWPKNGAMVIGELHTELRTGDKYFKLLYWDPNEEKPQQLYLKGCIKCTWYQYMATTSKIREFGRNSKTCQI